MTDEEAHRLVTELERDRGKYGGWNFAYEYPGFFVYYKSPFAVFFTPDWSTNGFVAIQVNVNDQPDDRYMGNDVPFHPRTSDRLFQIVRPVLDAVDGFKILSNGEKN
jgi:hypothetical protein